MKPYFGKQVIEKPRSGSGNPSLKMRFVGRMDEDGEYDGPIRIPMSMRSSDKFSHKLGEKNFTDVLGPVTGYLTKSIGKRWDDVFSELSKALGQGSYPIRHVLYSHILTSRWRSWRMPNSPMDYSVRGGSLYVDDDGIIRYKAAVNWNKVRRERLAAEPVTVVGIDGERFFVEIEGIWYIGKYVTDPVLGKQFVKDKQANKKELKDLRVRLLSK